MVYRVGIVGTGDPDGPGADGSGMAYGNADSYALDDSDPGPEGYGMAYIHADGYRDLDDRDLVARGETAPETAEAFAEKFDRPVESVHGGGPGAGGSGVAYRHADGYRELDDCELVACVDIADGTAEAFAAEFELSEAGVYGSHGAMLADADPDIVSVTVPPAFRADITIDCAKAGVAAVHCGSPMADTWGAARRMAEECWRHDVQLTFNHQRRFGEPFRRAKGLLDAGEIGALRRVEFSVGTLYDYGTHGFDLSNYFAGDCPAEWVLAGIDYHEGDIASGTHNENQAVAVWAYGDGVHGLATTGDPGARAVGCRNRLVGTDGVIEVGAEDAEAVVRVRRDGSGWEPLDTGGEGLRGRAYIGRGIADLVDCLGADRKSELRAENALNATELSFGARESARRRGRVDFPLEIEDSPLAAMVESTDFLQ